MTRMATTAMAALVTGGYQAPWLKSAAQGHRIAGSSCAKASSPAGSGCVKVSRLTPPPASAASPPEDLPPAQDHEKTREASRTRAAYLTRPVQETFRLLEAVDRCGDDWDMVAHVRRTHMRTRARAHARTHARIRTCIRTRAHAAQSAHARTWARSFRLHTHTHARALRAQASPRPPVGERALTRRAMV